MQVPSYIQGRESSSARNVSSCKTWLQNYLGVHVQHIQELKQYHVHIWDEEKKEYVVLEHCRHEDKKIIARGNFPEQDGS